MHLRPLDLLAVFLLSAPTLAIAGKCVLPVADGGDREPSPASLRGRIVDVAPGRIVVESRDGNRRVVQLTQQSGLWTVYGGGVDEADLRPGQHTRIWFKECVSPQRGNPVAAVVEICSLSADACPLADTGH